MSKRVNFTSTIRTTPKLRLNGIYEVWSRSRSFLGSVPQLAVHGPVAPSGKIAEGRHPSTDLTCTLASRLLPLSSPLNAASTIPRSFSPSPHTIQIKMRYQNWDVLVFPELSKVPQQEYKTTCQVVQDHGERIHPTKRSSILIVGRNPHDARQRRITSHGHFIHPQSSGSRRTPYLYSQLAKPGNEPLHTQLEKTYR